MVGVFNNLPAGTYAVSVYQDTNENEQLDQQPRRKRLNLTLH
ncbi:MAG: DUF2141 domain-containing protein [Treponema sp.]|nr:DUF2141 domain-containing protein [Treponema sp.]